jgi:uncharacterized repeat protein (TIGR01451 family)
MSFFGPLGQFMVKLCTVMNGYSFRNPIFAFMKTSFSFMLKMAGTFLLFLLNVNSISAQDIIPPVITLVGPDTVRIEVGTFYTDAGATAFDETDGDITPNMVMNSGPDVNVTGLYTVMYSVKDKAGNSAVPVMRLVYVMNDLTKPLITLNPGAPGCIELNCSNPSYVDPGATATDTRFPFNLTSSIIVSGFVDTRKIGTYTLTYTVQDVAGNKAVPQTRKVCVDKSKAHGFTITPISGGFRIWTDESMGLARSSFKWHIDGKYLSGYDNKTELFYYPDYPSDNFHQVCMDEFFCDDTTTYRFCKIFGDTIIAPISGKVFFDADKDCKYDLSEKSLNYIPVKLLDNNGKLAATTYSYKGEYAFNVDNGQYKVELDIAATPMEIKCPFPGVDTLIELKPGQLSIQNLDFPVVCKSGYDIGVIQGPIGAFAIPGRPFYVSPIIGDLNAVYGNECNSNLNGKIKISIQGPAHFTASDTSALTPDSIQGNEFVYIVNNFSSFKQDGIRLAFLTDTLATIGDTVKVRIRVTPESGDNNPENNDVLHHFIVRTSFDPNMKEVYPVDVEPAYSDWMTYTVHFQNTGNAPAYKVRITDTLDANLDPASLELMGFSHTAQVGIRGQALVFNFPDILLPDSNSNEKASHGYFQYRVKPLKNLPEGTKIHNTAYIFFDYNKPVITNTTVNSFVAPPPVVGISTAKLPGAFKLFPNPGSGVFTVACDETVSTGASVEIYDLYGTLVYSLPFSTQGIQLDMRAFANGFYICKLNTGTAELYRTFVKQ